MINYRQNERKQKSRGVAPLAMAFAPG